MARYKWNQASVRYDLFQRQKTGCKWRINKKWGLWSR